MKKNIKFNIYTSDKPCPVDATARIAEIYADLIVDEIKKRGYNDAEIQLIITKLAEMKNVKL